VGAGREADEKRRLGMTAAVCAFTTISDILLRPDLLRLGWNIMLACVNGRTARRGGCADFLSSLIFHLYWEVVQLYCVRYAMQWSREQSTLVCVNVRGWVGAMISFPLSYSCATRGCSLCSITLKAIM
jgi:hypothetical protein